MKRTAREITLPSADVVGPAGVMLAAVAVAWACEAMPARLPAWAPWEFSWPEFLAAWLGAWFYGHGLARTPVLLRPGWARRVGFVGGTLLIYAVVQTHFDYLAQHMFTLTRVQHLVTHHLGPFLIVLSWPGAVLRRGMPGWLWRRIEGFGPLVRVVQQPVIAGVLFVGLIFVWLIPPVLFHAMLDRRLYALMNWSMVLDGLLFWSLVLDPRGQPPARVSRGVRLLLVFAVQWPQIFGGAVIGFVGRELYPYYSLCGRVFPAIDTVTDQQIGAFLIWFGGGMMSAVAAFIILRRLWAEEVVGLRSRITHRSCGLR